MKKRKYVMLSFDVEEFDLPREHGGEISVKEGAKVSGEGLVKILNLLAECGVRATFFITVNFAKEQPELVRRIYEEGHEVACHGVNHFSPKATDARECKKFLEGMLDGVRVVGYRQPRMGKINYEKLAEWGYEYDSSVNPAFIPGRYNNLKVSRKPYAVDGVLEIPTSAASFMRVPLFWLALHLFSLSVYCWLAKVAIGEVGYFATYFHPWEFATALSRYDAVPGYIKRNSGDKLVGRLRKVVRNLQGEGCEFVTYGEYVEGMK